MKKLLLLLTAFALVAGLSQCRKPNMPVLNIGETQHVVLNASWDNGGSKLEQVGTGLQWKVGDKLTVSGGLEGTLYCSFSDGVFEGEVKKNLEKKDVTFTFKSENYKDDYMSQTGALNDAVSLTGEAPYSADGKYDVSMEMPHAVLLLDLSALGTEGGTEVTIKADGTEVASVLNVKNTSTKVYVAFPVGAKMYKFESTVGSASCASEWNLEANKFYTLNDDEGHPTGQAIEIKP